MISGMNKEYVIEFCVDSHEDEWVVYDVYSDADKVQQKIDDIERDGFISRFRVRKRYVSDWEMEYESGEEEVSEAAGR